MELVFKYCDIYNDDITNGDMYVGNTTNGDMYIGNITISNNVPFSPIKSIDICEYNANIVLML